MSAPESPENRGYLGLSIGDHVEVRRTTGDWKVGRVIDIGTPAGGLPFIKFRFTLSTKVIYAPHWGSYIRPLRDAAAANVSSRRPTGSGPASFASPTRVATKDAEELERVEAEKPCLHNSEKSKTTPPLKVKDRNRVSCLRAKAESEKKSGDSMTTPGVNGNAKPDMEIKASRNYESRDDDSIVCEVISGDGERRNDPLESFDGDDDTMTCPVGDDESLAFSVMGTCVVDNGPDVAQDVEQCDVIILGAGAAGIGAARSLLANDSTLNVIVVEARDRPGGRAWTSDELMSGVGLDHGAKLTHCNKSKPTKSTIDLDLLRTDSLDSTGSDAAKDDNTPSRNDHADVYPNVARKHRMLWNTEGYLERVGVDGDNIGDVDSAAEAEQDLSEHSRIHHQAARFLYKDICRISETNSIEAIKDRLPREATYKDILDELASNEEDPRDNFEEWMYARAEKALQFLLQDGPTPRPSDVHQVIAILHLKIYNFCDDYGCFQWKCLLDGIPGKMTQDVGTSRGFGQLLENLASEIRIDKGHSRKIDIRYNQEASLVVDTLGGLTEVSTVDISGKRRQYIARVGCICAIPLGVLRQPKSRITFNPPLPEEVNLAMSRLSVFSMNKIEMLFPQQWWPKNTGELDLALYTLNAALEEPPSHRQGEIAFSNWVVEMDDPAIIACYASGDFAERIELMADKEVEDLAVEALRSALVYDGSNIASIPDPVRTFCTRWQSDPFSMGCWTVAPVSSEGIKDASAFQLFNTKNERNLFFAGEHTCDGSTNGLDIGTVHGAFNSGITAATLLLQNRELKNAPPQPDVEDEKEV